MASIKEILQQKGFKIIRYSDSAEKIKKFDGWLSSQLFTFLINNQLNRYLFNSLIRLGTLNIDDMPFNVDIFTPSRIKDKTKESFIKKLICTGCGQVLFNDSYVDITKIKEGEEIECAKCKLRTEFRYNSLEDSFDLTKRIVAEYLEQLSNRGIISNKYVKHCLTCRSKKKIDEISQINFNLLKCERCGRTCNVLKEYFVEDEFIQDCLLRRGGEWFEWYVYKLCSYMHEETEHGLIIELSSGDELEIDVVGRDGTNLIIYECKDTQKVADWGDFKRIPDLIQNFENVTLVTSYDTNMRDLKNAVEPYKKDIKVIKGIELEDSFIGVNATLVRLRSDEWPYNQKGKESFGQLSITKKVEIIKTLLKSISDEVDLENNINAYLKISGLYFFKELLLPEQKKMILNIFNEFRAKIMIKENFKRLPVNSGSYILQFVNSIINLMSKEELVYISNPLEHFKLMLDCIEGKLNSNYNGFAAVYYIYLFEKFDNLEKILDKSDLNRFLDLFIQHLGMFGTWERKHEVLVIINRLLPYLDTEHIKIVTNNLEVNVSSYSWSVNWQIKDICLKVYSKSDDLSKIQIKSIFNKMLEKSDASSKAYATEALTIIQK